MSITLSTAAVALQAAAAVGALWRGAWARGLLAGGVLAQGAALASRGLAIGAFPLTSKHESFAALGLALALVALTSWRDQRWYTVPLVLLASGTGAAAFVFPHALRYPPPLMQTIWYPLHVPLAFGAYALWAGAAAAALAWWRDRDGAWLARLDRLALQGFGLWSLSMICGGIWGVVAWGAYFLWDPKIIWSVLLWLHYASFLHLRLTPSLAGRAWVRPALAGLGLVWVAVAYVGTSFLFGGSSHAF